LDANCPPGRAGRINVAACNQVDATAEDKAALVSTRSVKNLISGFIDRLQ
jgi:hypothetical protein